MADSRERWALILGASSGMGEATARALAAQGATVAGVARRKDRLDALAADIGGLAIEADVTDREQAEAAVERAARELGRVDIVVNNAGTSHRNQPMLDVSEEEFDRVFAVNVKSIYLMAKALVPHFRVIGGGNILNIGSTAGIRPRPGLAWYNASKGAVNLVSKSMAVELAPDRIRVNAIAPGLMNTENALADLPTPLIDQFVHKLQLVHRLGTMDDVVSAMLFLCSDEASFITGETLKVSGGYPLNF